MSRNIASIIIVTITGLIILCIGTLVASDIREHEREAREQEAIMAACKNSSYDFIGELECTGSKYRQRCKPVPTWVCHDGDK